MSVPLFFIYQQRLKLYHDQLRLIKRNETSHLDFDAIEALRKSTLVIYNILEKTGSHIRDSDIEMSVSLCAVYSLLPLIYYSAQRFYRNELSKKMGVLFFMQDYEAEMRNLDNRVDDCIFKNQISIVTHMKVLTANEKINGHLDYHDSLERSSQQLIGQVESIVKDMNIMDKDLSGNSTSSPEMVKQLIVALLAKRSELNRSISTLNLALDYLNQLRFTRTKHLIWPVNRNRSRQRVLLTNWTRCFICTSVSYWFACMITGHLIFAMTHERLIAHSELDNYPRGFHFIECFEMLLTRAFVMATVDWCSEPMAYLYTSFLDQKLYLTSIDERLRKFKGELISLIRDYDEVGENICYELNSKLLESYVSFQIFTKEIRTMFKRAEHSVIFLYSSLLMAILLLVALSFASHQMSILRLVALVWIILLNFCIVPHAQLNQRCQEISKLVYSIIANAELINSKAKRDRNSNKLCQISTHTLNSWRKIIADSRLYSEEYSCELLRIASLNYGTIFRLNFAIISSTAFLLTHC